MSSTDLLIKTREADVRYCYSVVRQKTDPRAHDLLAKLEEQHVETLRFLYEEAVRKVTNAA